MGSTVYIVSFSRIQTLSLMTIAFANGMAPGGFTFMCISVLSFAAGIVLPMIVYGFNYVPSSFLAMNLLSAATLLVYFIMFALVAYRRSVLLQESRRFQRQQRNVVEIEKQNRKIF